MSIEFPCTGCQQTLRVPDDSMGKQARCPNCSTILTVPAPQPVVSIPATAAGPSGAGKSAFGYPDAMPQNPYASPAEASQPPDPTGAGTLSVQPMDPGTALSAAWYLFKLNTGLLVGAYLLHMGANIGISVAGGILQAILIQVFGDPNAPAVVLTNVGTSLLNNLIQLWIGIGLLRINLSVARGLPTDFGMLFSGGPWLLRYIGASILFGLGMVIGLVLLIVPGIYFALTYWSYMYFLVDRDCGVLESFRLAGRHASGNRANAFVMGLLGAAISLLGLLACGVGLLIAAPVATLMIAVCYLMMSGQRYIQPV